MSRAKYSKPLVDSLKGYVDKPCKLIMKIQETKGREICKLIVDGKISISLARLMLKTICLPDDAMNLIIDSAIIKNDCDTSKMGMHDLNGFHSQIDYSNLNGIGFPDFATCCGKNLTYQKLSGSPMHNLFLGKLNPFAAFKFASKHGQNRQFKIIDCVFAQVSKTFKHS